MFASFRRVAAVPAAIPGGRPWLLNSVASISGFRIKLPKPRQRVPLPKKIKHHTENLSIKEYGIQRLVYVAAQKRTYLVVNRKAQTDGSAPAPAKTADSKSNSPEDNLNFVLVPPVLKLELPDQNNLSVTYHKHDKYLFNTFLKHLQHAIKGQEILHKKKLILKGLGFRMSLENNNKTLQFKLGFSHLVEKDIPATVTARLKKNILILESTNKVLLGNYAAQIQQLKPPEAYKEKGIYFAGDKVRIKPIKKK